MAFPYLLGVGLVILLHSFRSRATSWVTPTPVMSYLICWCRVFLRRPCLLLFPVLYGQRDPVSTLRGSREASSSPWYSSLSSCCSFTFIAPSLVVHLHRPAFARLYNILLFILCACDPDFGATFTLYLCLFVCRKFGAQSSTFIALEVHISGHWRASLCAL